MPDLEIDQPIPYEQGDEVTVIRRQVLEAVVVTACPNCGAPGAYNSHESIRDGWPGCHVSPSDPRDHKPVGMTCPNCGARRSPDKPLGVIWWKEWLAKVFPPRSSSNNPISESTDGT